MENESIPEATLAKLFNGQQSGDEISDFDDMKDGFTLYVTVTTAFIDRIELYANEIEKDVRPQWLEVSAAPVGNGTNQFD